MIKLKINKVKRDVNKGKKKSLIKTLLSGKLAQEQKTSFADIESVNEVLKKQWNEAKSKTVDMRIKQLIWEKVKAKCEGKKSNQVFIELRWHLVAVSLALFLVVGGFWFNSKSGSIGEIIQVIAHQKQMHTLPDSTKVWMEPGSSIKYAKAFSKDRKVWLSGNSLFEVRKQTGSTFRVYIDKAFIEVKGTCFLIKQQNPEENEITLFNGEIEFNVESTGKRTSMSPMQKMIYNSRNAQTKVEEITNIKWENGKYNFTDIPLQKLIEIINLMYDTNIVLSENINHESAFTGNIRYNESLNNVIEKICYILNLSYKMENDKINIY